LLKDDDAGGHEGKRTGFSLPLSQQRGQAPLSSQQLISSHQYPGAVNQPNIPGVGGPLYPANHLHGGSSPAETNNMGLMNSPAQMHQGAVPNHIGPSPVRPPMGFEMGNRDGHFERDDPHSYGRFDGANTFQQQPKLAAVPPSQNPLVIIFDTATYLNEVKSSLIILPKLFCYIMMLHENYFPPLYYYDWYLNEE